MNTNLNAFFLIWMLKIYYNFLILIPSWTAKIVTFFDIPPAADEIPLFVHALMGFGQQIAKSIYQKQGTKLNKRLN